MHHGRREISSSLSRFYPHDHQSMKNKLQGRMKGRKKRWRKEGSALFAHKHHMASWTDLPEEIVECILQKIDTPVDFLSFGAVCKPWHSISKHNYNRFPESLPIRNFYPKVCPLPMLLVPLDDVHGKPYLYSITENKTYNCPYGSVFRDKWMPGSAKGWLVTIGTYTKSINLMNPLTTKQIPLPGLFTFDKPLSMYDHYEAQHCCYVTKATILFDSSGQPENSVIVAVVSSMKRICFCRVGDDRWRTVERSPVHIHDIINFQGKLFAVDDAGRLFDIEIGGLVKWTLVAGELKVSSTQSELYLVESGKQILLVVRDVKESLQTDRFRVFKLVESASKYQVSYELEDRSHHKMNGVQFKWVELESIGEQMIFLGYNHSLSVDSRAYPGCRGNRIYFADYMTDIDFRRFFSTWDRRHHDIGAYDLKNKRVESMKGMKRLSRHHALWLSPCI